MSPKHDELSSTEGCRIREAHGRNDVVLDAVKAERARQLVKWGSQVHSFDRWLVILMEEVGEACKAAFQGDWPGVKRELIHIAAVAVAIATGIG